MAFLAGDHPRSRGVYRKTGDWDPLPSGSSPLARGLLDGDISGAINTRIIPARAGFTPTACIPELTVLGSSPLARGLHPVRSAGRRRLGIIPARAGFTATGIPAYAGSKDHPRSRGVY